ncbi:hypothetical protein C0J52_00558 [Blattella germanica]|nr:hypothetical protein C0J52_00558 [Blattella germanica]
MMGNGFEYGNYEECIDVKASGDYGNFTGKHCVVDFPLPIPSEYSSNENLYDIVKFRWSICVPSSCRGTDLTYLIKYGLHQSAVVNERACITKDTNRPLLPWEIFTLCVIGVFLMLVLLSTLYDHFKSSAKKNEFFQSFSITRNFKTMMDMSTPPGSIDALHGIRFSCTVGVILAHVYMCVCIGANVNLIHYTYWLSDWDHLYITSRGVMLDAFFLLGGFLVSYIFMKERNSGKKFNLALYILHRFLRIAPAMYMVLLITATLSNRLSVAPLWRTWSEINERKCHETWWQHVLFIQSWYGNLYCMEHAWYLSVDMQLFIISPIMLYPLHRWPKIGIGVTIFTIVLSFFGSFTSSYLYRENVDLFRNSFKIERDLYELPYNRLGPWAIGIFCGYIAYQNRHYKNNKSEEGNHGCNDSPGKRCKKV